MEASEKLKTSLRTLAPLTLLGFLMLHDGFTAEARHCGQAQETKDRVPLTLSSQPMVLRLSSANFKAVSGSRPGLNYSSFFSYKSLSLRRKCRSLLDLIRGNFLIFSSSEA